jgi:hypothetical protein
MLEGMNMFWEILSWVFTALYLSPIFFLGYIAAYLIHVKPWRKWTRGGRNTDADSSGGASRGGKDGFSPTFSRQPMVGDDPTAKAVTDESGDTLDPPFCSGIVFFGVSLGALVSLFKPRGALDSDDGDDDFPLRKEDPLWDSPLMAGYAGNPWHDRSWDDDDRSWADSSTIQYEE